VATSDEVLEAVRKERENCARIAESFQREYGPDVGRMAKRIAEVIRRQAARDAIPS
jgi:hypothetical protein